MSRRLLVPFASVVALVSLVLAVVSLHSGDVQMATWWLVMSVANRLTTLRSA